jgi:dipeptidyl aminopeptidase/acylaminoacyl peptidase
MNAMSSLRLRAACLVFALAIVDVRGAQDVLTPHRVADLRSVSSVALSPDGKLVAYTLAVPRKVGQEDDGAPWSELHVIGLMDGADRPFITGKVDIGGVSWTPDGKSIAFLSKRGDDKFTSLYLISADGGEARRALAFTSSIGAYDLAPDGKRVAFAAADPEDEARKKLADKGFKQEVYEEDVHPARVWIATLFDEKEKARPLSLEGSVHQVHWSPVDERLLLTVTPTPLVDDEYMEQRVRIVDAGSGKVLAQIENPGKLGEVEWSPDGKRVALCAAADLHDPSAGRMMVAPATGGVPREVVPNAQADVHQLAWQNGEDLMYVASVGAETMFGKVHVSAQSGADEASVPTEIIRTGGPILSALSLSRDGQHAAFIASTPAHPPEVYTMSHKNAGPERRTTSNPWLASTRLAPQEVVRFKARDGLDLEGVLIRPLDEVKGQRYPLILCVHGGPEAHEQNGWETSYSKPGQVAAARGIAVFHPNYRGSTGRGVAFSKLGQGDPAGKEFDDLIDAIDHLVALGLVDKAKVGVTGGSYGGYATAWCSTKLTDRFQAGVMLAGISDKVSKVGTTDIPNEEFLVHALHRPWEVWSLLLERSPITYAGQSKTPLLILHGKDDPRVNPGQARELYRHLRMHGQAPVRLVLYPGEGHGNRKSPDRLDYNLRMMQWMEHYLLGPGGAPPTYVIDYADPAQKKDA